jgi:hypothetical protein
VPLPPNPSPPDPRLTALDNASIKKIVSYLAGRTSVRIPASFAWVEGEVGTIQPKVRAGLAGLAVTAGNGNLTVYFPIPHLRSFDLPATPSESDQLLVDSVLVTMKRPKASEAVITSVSLHDTSALGYLPDSWTGHHLARALRNAEARGLEGYATDVVLPVEASDLGVGRSHEGGLVVAIALEFRGGPGDSPGLPEVLRIPFDRYSAALDYELVWPSVTYPPPETWVTFTQVGIDYRWSNQ